MTNPKKDGRRTTVVTRRGAAAKAAAATLEAATSDDKKKKTRPTKLSSIDRRLKALPPKGQTPIWIQYYEEEAKDPLSDYGKGYNKPRDFYERLMETYVSCNDSFYDTLQQNPESCAVIYSDGAGTMRILHHLTAELHGKPIIVGLDGFGSMCKVKAVHEELIVASCVLGDSEGKLAVPDLSDFLANPIDDIDTSTKIDPGDGAEDYTALSQVFESQPTGYLIHPAWLPFIYHTVGRTPEIMGNALVTGFKRQIGADTTSPADLESALDEIYPFLVFLWASHLKAMGNRPGRDHNFQNSDGRNVGLGSGQVEPRCFYYPIGSTLPRRLRHRLHKRTWKDHRLTLSEGERASLREFNFT